MLQFYPFPEHRPGTRDALKKVRKAMEDGKRFIIIKAPTGCHAPGTKVIKADGTLVSVEDVRVGDRLLGPDGAVRTVLALHSGTEDMYKISPLRKGNPFVVNAGHVLSLKATNEGDYRRIANRHKNANRGGEVTNISVSEYLVKSKSWKHLYKLYHAGVETFPDARRERLPLSPYFLGVLLGDGSITKCVKVTTADAEIKNECLIQAENFGLNITLYGKQGTIAQDITLSGGASGGKENPIARLLRQLGLYGKKSHSKFIPQQYKTSSTHARLELLAGLIDTDGSKSGPTGIEFTVKSMQLAKDFAFVARSLGLAATESLREVQGNTYFRVHLSGNTSVIPIRLSRKKTSEHLQKKDPLVSGFKVEPQGIGQYYGFEVDGDNLYLLEDFTVTHNSGKSGLAVAIARSEKAAILTPTKLLQDQYENTDVFTTEYTIKGKNNYKCGLKNFKNVTVDKAICCSNATASENADMTPWEDAVKGKKNASAALKGRCVSAGICEYYKLLNGIPTNPGAIMNYDLAFLVKKRPGSQEGIDLGETLVLDEAHQLVGKIKSVFGFSLTQKAAGRILGLAAKRQAKEGAIEWLTRLYGLAQTAAAEETDLKRAPELSNFLSSLEGILALPIDDEYKFHIEEAKDRVEIKPLNMRYLKGMVFHPFKHVVMMSATIPPNFCDLLGLKEEETEIIEIPSTFPRENRPVVYVNNLEALNYRTQLNSRHPTFKALQKILKDHKGEKGIVHCSNYRIFEELKKAYPRNSRFIWVERGMDKTKVLEKHAKSDKDTVLVSPSMLEGVDLKDDLARFQIMLKLPYARLDDYTKKMMKIYEGYYEADVIMNITQAYGRAIRTEEDYATFYILDGAFSRLLKNKNSIPKYLFEAIHSKKIEV